MPCVRLWQALACTWLILLALPALLWAHGFAGKRFFPTTLATDDPFVADELSLLISHIKEPGEGEKSPTVATEIAAEYSKRITPSLGFSLGGEFRHLNPEEEGTESGFGNLELGVKYQFFTSPRHEALFALGLEAAVGGTGNHTVEAEPFSTLSPALFFGKGFGDLPEAVRYLRPLAITGLLGVNVPTRSKTVTTHRRLLNGALETEQEIEQHPVTLSWGGSLQYNMQYLQAFVKDIGLGAPFNRMIPLVEISLDTCLNRGCGGETTGTVNPGLIWFGKSVQLGIEAVIPINTQTGHRVGVLGLVHFFIDDLFPHSLGRPIFR